MKTRIENVTVLTCDLNQSTFFGSVTFEEDRIIAFNDTSPCDILIDGQDGILMPGMINTHTHLSMIPFRSLQDDLPDRLRLFLFPLEKETMTQDLACAAAKIGVAESLLSGVTTVYDMYYFSDALAKTYETMGMRAYVAQTILNQDLCDAHTEAEGFDLATSFHQKWKSHPLITPALGPHGTTTVSKEMLLKIQAYAQKEKAHVCMHVSEMDYEMDFFRKQDSSPIQYLNQLGLLNSNFTAVHVIHADEKDIETLNQTQTGVAHCIGANTKAGKGIPPLKSMIQHGVTVGLGTDGPSSGNTLDLFVQMNLLAKMHKVFNHDRSLFKAKEIVQMATLGGAKVLNLDSKIGSIELGKKADLVLLETNSINMFPHHDPYSVLVYSANPSNVHSVWVNGIQKVQNKQLVDISLSQLKDTCKNEMNAFMKKMKEIEKTL